MKTRQEVQDEALNTVVEKEYNGTVVLSTGTGKSKVAIDAIRKGKFKNILITSPRTNLKNNWEEELQKWNFALTTTSKILDLTDSDYFPNVFKENIQTCYKWEDRTLQELDLIICDEIHTMATEEYGKLLVNANRLGIPVIGLTATPDDEKEDKKDFYNSYCPIIYRYTESADHGIINSRKYIVISYSLSNDHKVMAGTKTKQWAVGEEDQYLYLSEQIRKGQKLMAQTGSEDWFRDAAKWFWKGEGTTEEKNAARVYLQSINKRKYFLWGLSSSVDIALKLKKRILDNPDNKILLFSEQTSQAERLSAYSIHSKQSEEINSNLLKMFDTDEITELSSVRSLTLGLNLKKPNYAIMESFTSSAVQFQQKAGRTDRLPVNDTATVIWIVPKNTQAERWFQSAVKYVDKEELEVYDLDSNELNNLTI